MMVQQPHWPLGEHPSLAEVMFNSSRKAARRCGWSLATDTGWPLTVNDTLVSSGGEAVIT
jgi:hypothetical protein